MKGIFIAYNQAYNEEIVALLSAHGLRGYTKWTGVGGRGTVDGEPHLGTHAWPTQNHALFAAVPDDKVPDLMAGLRAVDAAAPDLGLRAYAWTIDEAC